MRLRFEAGAVISPLLHYVLDQWTDQWRQQAQGDVIIVRYADDAVVGFQHEYEAKKFLKDLRTTEQARAAHWPCARR